MSAGSGDSWDDLAEWWTGEVAGDPAYDLDVHPLLETLLPEVDGRIIDLGCGEGQGMRLIGGDVFGVDLSPSLARTAAAAGPVVVADLPDMSYFVDACFQLAVSVYLLDLVEDHETFFRSCARIIASGGWLVLVINHPVYTAPGAAPIVDDDGEVLWRWGDYFGPGSALEPAGHREIRFHHRPLDQLLTSASQAGWVLEVMAERPLSADTIEALPGYIGQDRIPRLLGLRWMRAGAPGAPR